MDALGVTPDQAMIDVGGGESVLAARHLARGFRDVRLLDLSAAGLDFAREALGGKAGRVHWLHQGVRAGRPDQRYRVWHARAVFHFLVEDTERKA